MLIILGFYFLIIKKYNFVLYVMHITPHLHVVITPKNLKI